MVNAIDPVSCNRIVCVTLHDDLINLPRKTSFYFMSKAILSRLLTLLLLLSKCPTSLNCPPASGIDHFEKHVAWGGGGGGGGGSGILITTLIHEA